MLAGAPCTCLPEKEPCQAQVLEGHATLLPPRGTTPLSLVCHLFTVSTYQLSQLKSPCLY